MSGKTALVTGAAQGIGAAIATLFVDEGARVVLADTNAAQGEELAAQLGRKGVARFVQLDVADEDNWARAVRSVANEFGAVDILVNNAGIGSVEPAETEVLPVWQRTVEVNQTGCWLGIRAVVPGMRAQGRGSIVNVCSVLGIAGDTASIAYQATKGAIRMLSKNVAMTYVGDGIRCNTVCPGMVATGMAELEVDGTVDEWLGLTPMHRFGTPPEIAYGALFLASDEASFITGIDLVIDGGYLAR